MVEEDDDVPAAGEFVLALNEALFLAKASWAALEFCSSVCAVFVLISNICFVVSFACCNVVLYASKLENIKLFVVLNAVTVLSATVLTNLLYAFAAASGDIQLFTVVL